VHGSNKEMLLASGVDENAGPRSWRPPRPRFFEGAAIKISPSNFLGDTHSVFSGVSPTFGIFDASEDTLDLCIMMTKEATALTPKDLPVVALEEGQNFLGFQIGWKSFANTG